MAVRVTETCRVNYNYGVWDLVAGQEIADGEYADYLLRTGAPVVAITDSTGDVDGDGVPDGTAKDVLGWVGDDPARAALALQAENRREKPRSTLVADLEKVAAPGEPGEPAGGAQ